MTEPPNREELLASDYEYALALAEILPEAGGPEYWLIQIQALRKYAREQAEWLQQMIGTFNEVFSEMGEAVSHIIEAFSDLLDDLETAPFRQLCPRHGSELTAGGHCLRCIRRSN